MARFASYTPGRGDIFNKINFFQKDIKEDSIEFLFEGNREVLTGIDDLVVSEKAVSIRDSAALCSKNSIETFIIGDAKSPGSIMTAIAGAEELSNSMLEK